MSAYEQLLEANILGGLETDMGIDLKKAAFGLTACAFGLLLLAFAFTGDLDVDNGAIAIAGAIITAGGIIAVSISQLPDRKS